MYFTRSSPLPPEFQFMAGYLETVEECLAAGLPAKRVYSEEEMLGFDRPDRFGALKVVDALQATGVVTNETFLRHIDHNFLYEEGWDEDEANYERHTQYVLTGSLVRLIEDLKSANDAQPYFISFYSAEGRSAAESLHQALQSAGVTGFLSDDLQSGDQYRDDIVRALKSCKTVFLIESADYHTRSRCKVERDFAVAKGARILRLLICDPSRLNQVPVWLNEDFNYEVVQDDSGFRLNDRVLGLSLTSKVSDLQRRRRAGLDLIARLTAPQVRSEAMKLGVEEELAGAASDQKGQLAAAAFASDTQADRFCRELDLISQF